MIRYLFAGEIQLAIMALLSGVFFVVCVAPLHEFAHAKVADMLGDTTARHNGRLTLNPIAHIDPIGGLMILLFGFGYAKAVPVNMRNFRNPKRDMALTALAGPAVNLVIAFIFVILSRAVQYVSVLSPELRMTIAMFLGFVIEINIALAVFNMLPIPPLDGSRILSAFLPDRTYYKLMQYERYFFIGLMVLVAFGGFNVIGNVIFAISDYIYMAFDFVVSLVF